MSKADIFNIYKYLKEKDINSYNSKVPAHFKNALGNSTNEAKTPIYNPKRTRKPVYLNINSNSGGIKFPNFPELGTSVKLTTDDIIWTDDLFDLDTPPTVTKIIIGEFKGFFYYKEGYILVSPSGGLTGSLTYIYKTTTNFTNKTTLLSIPYRVDLSALNPVTNKLFCYTLVDGRADYSYIHVINLNNLTVTTNRLSSYPIFKIFYSSTGCVSFFGSRGEDFYTKMSREHVLNYGNCNSESSAVGYNYRWGDTLNGIEGLSYYGFTNYYHNLKLRLDGLKLQHRSITSVQELCTLPTSETYYRYAHNDNLFLALRDGIYKITFKINTKYLYLNKPKIVIYNDPTFFNMVKNLIPYLTFPFKSIGILKNGKFLIDPHTMYYTYRDTWQYLN